MFRPITQTLLDNITHEIDKADHEIIKFENYIENMLVNKKEYTDQTIKEAVCLFTECILRENNKINDLVKTQKELMIKEKL